MRRRRPEKRSILPDTKYNDLSVAKFINYIMESGKKGVAEKIFYSAIYIPKIISSFYEQLVVSTLDKKIIFLTCVFE